jgi:hypothetical protein
VSLDIIWATVGMMALEQSTNFKYAILDFTKFTSRARQGDFLGHLLFAPEERQRALQDALGSSEYDYTTEYCARFHSDTNTAHKRNERGLPVCAAFAAVNFKPRVAVRLKRQHVGAQCASYPAMGNVEKSLPDRDIRRAVPIQFLERFGLRLRD